MFQIKILGDNLYVQYCVQANGLYCGSYIVFVVVVIIVVTDVVIVVVITFIIVVTLEPSQELPNFF